MHEAFEVLTDVIRAASQEELPCLLGRIVEAEASVRLRLFAPAATPPTPPAGEAPQGQYLTVREAAAIAQASQRRIYEWARGARWAHRPTKRCLRIDEAAFRRWLERP
jgi:hypothetical protein